MRQNRFELLNGAGVTRRALLAMPVAFAGLAAATWPKERPVPDAKENGTGKKVKLVLFSDDGKREGVVELQQIKKSDDEWRKQLEPDEFAITRKAATERAFTGRYWDNHERGIYRCVCCGTAVFSSSTKFESGTGWPSFWEPIARENVRERSDSSIGMSRTEVLCTKCDAHLGHVFDDGPPPTHLRYCMNSMAMIFIKA
jgi:peptide-methionine (R)-S-oxide reductase